MTYSARRYLLGALSGVAVVGASVSGIHQLSSTRGSSTSASLNGSQVVSCTVVSGVTSCQQSAPRPRAGDAPASDYRDGGYDALGHYLTPGGSESIGVSVTVSHGVVTSARVEVEATSPTARQFQEQFASRYAGQVVAKNLADVRVSRVAGASLTSVGFTDALTQIRSAARV